MILFFVVMVFFFLHGSDIEATKRGFDIVFYITSFNMIVIFILFYKIKPFIRKVNLKTYGSQSLIFLNKSSKKIEKAMVEDVVIHFLFYCALLSSKYFYEQGGMIFEAWTFLYSLILFLSIKKTSETFEGYLIMKGISKKG